jgi:hypothetical protein
MTRRKGSDLCCSNLRRGANDAERMTQFEVDLMHLQLLDRISDIPYYIWC